MRTAIPQPELGSKPSSSSLLPLGLCSVPAVLWVEGALLPHSSLWVCLALVPWHCLPWPETEVERHKHQGEKRKKNQTKTEKGLLLQYFQPIKPRLGILRESQLSQNPKPRDLEKQSQDLHPPCHQDPKVFGGAELRHLQGCSAARAGIWAAPPFPPLNFHGFLCVCAAEPPHPSQESSFWPSWLFPCPSSSFWEQKPATPVHRASALGQSWGRAAQDNSAMS